MRTFLSQIDRVWSRTGAAVAASIAAHVTLLLLLGLPVTRPALSPPSLTVELDLVDVNRGPPVTPWAQPEGPQVSRAPARPVERPSPARKPPPPADAPASGRRAGPIFLTPTVDQLARAGLSTTGELIEARAPEPPGWNARLEALAREDRARDALAMNRAPPVVFDLLRDAVRLYRPSHELVIDMARAEAGREHAPQRWTRRYLGGFLDRDRAVDERGRPAKVDRTMMAGFNRAMKRAPLRYAARVCVTLHPERAPVVELTRSSGMPRWDRLAMQVMTEAAERLPARDAPVSTRPCFRFTATLTRVPPLINAIAVGQWPLKELVNTRLTLDGLERPDHDAVAGP